MPRAVLRYFRCMEHDERMSDAYVSTGCRLAMLGCQAARLGEQFKDLVLKMTCALSMRSLQAIEKPSAMFRLEDFSPAVQVL